MNAHKESEMFSQEIEEHRVSEEAEALAWLEAVLGGEASRTVYVDCPLGELRRRLRELLSSRFKRKQIETKVFKWGVLLVSKTSVVCFPAYRREAYDFRHVTDVLEYIPASYEKERLRCERLSCGKLWRKEEVSSHYCPDCGCYLRLDWVEDGVTKGVES